VSDAVAVLVAHKPEIDRGRLELHAEVPEGGERRGRGS
jgi:hypothetical protein